MGDGADKVRFLDDPSSVAEEAAGTEPVWCVLIVDDDADVHEATIYTLKGVRILGRPLAFLHAHTAAEALTTLAASDEIAVVLLDVVMESPTAGLDAVEALRRDGRHAATRIILRTGQPGHAPDLETVRRYDINDYYTKSELTRARLCIALSTALRTYQQLRQAEASRHFLEQVVAATRRLIAKPDLAAYAAGLLDELAGLATVPVAGAVAVVAPDGARVVAASGILAGLRGRRLDDLDDAALVRDITHCLDSRRGVFDEQRVTLPLADAGQRPTLIVHLRSAQRLPALEAALVDVFCSNVALGAEKVALTERLHRQAYVDGLVGLPNRNALIEAIDARRAEAPAGLVLNLVDIDQFAELNDMFGHHCADELLAELARRLRAGLGEGALVARVGADTFGLLGPEAVVGPEAARELLRAPFSLLGSDYVMSACMGLARLDEGTGGGSDCLKDASIALKRAKSGGQGQVAWFTPAIGNETRERARLLQSLRDAFSYERLFVAYQPQLTLGDGRLIGCEALVRWRAEDGSYVPPDRFIPVAENSGLIVALGAWVLRSALREVASWRAAGWTELHVAVNVSVVQFRHPDFVATVIDALAAAAVPPSALELEITESVAMIGATVVADAFSRLRQHGVLLAIDDFGTGYSSLSYLDRLPVDRIKIDRSFVRALDSGERGARIAEMVIPLGRQLGMQVLAEGVETDEQRRRLAALGCDEGQGYLFARPMPPAELNDWLDAWRVSGPRERS